MMMPRPKLNPLMSKLRILSLPRPSRRRRLQQMYGGGEDVDDEIDFNLGGNGTTYDSPANHEAHGPGIKEDG
jgi:hypothetical protein